MADIQSNINVNIDTSNALAAVKQLQAQISAFHSSIRNSGNAANQALSDNLTKNLVNSINATKQFSASLTTVNNRAQAFTSALEKNKFSLGQYFRYGAASTKTFGKVFRKEFNTIEQVAQERVKTMQTQFITLGKNAGGAFEAIKVKPLTLDMQNLGTQVAMTAQKQQMFNQLLTQGSTNLLNFGKNTQWAGRQLMVGLTIPLSLLGGAAMKTFSEMEEQAIRFKRVYGELFTTESETNAMVEELDALARSFTKYGVAVADTMSLAADAAAMGKMGADLTAQVSEATRLAVLGGVEQSEALQTTISITNAFGTAAEELAGKIDFLNAVENQTVTSIEDLTIAIPKAGPVIKELGGDVEDLAFFLTAMKEGGINASEGANALKSGLARMINPTKAASEFLAQFNINVNEIVESNAGNITGAVLELASALDTLDPLNKSRAIEELFGRFQFARISTLFNNVVAQGNQAQRVLQLTASTSEELAILSERELGRVEDSPLYKYQKAVEDVQKALMPLGQQFMELITPLLQFATRLLEGFNNLDGGVKKFITGAIAALGLIAPVALMTFGLFANGIANLIKGFGLIRGLFLKVTYAGTGLSSQLSYMTQEHLEAASAANALGSTHGNLMNIFTAETTAIQNLIRAYDQATAAIQRNNVAAGTRARGGAAGSMKLASGIVSVPGPKGAGDIVPAMLSPGEAVVPAEMAQKYAPLIRGMISDNIPGYSKGREGRRGDNRAGTTERRYTKDFIEEYGEDQGQAYAERQRQITEAEQRAIKKAAKQNEKITGPVADRYWEQTDAAHLADKSSGFKFGKTVRAESAVSNNILNSFKGPGAGNAQNREALKKYLQKQTQSSKQTNAILKQLEQGYGLTGKNEKLFGKALDEVGADLRSGKATYSRSGKGKTFAGTGIRYAGVAGAAIGARQEEYEKLPPKERRVLEGQRQAVRKNTKATEQDTKATQKKTATTKKATNTTAKSERAEARSAAAKKGWETRRANAAAGAGMAPGMAAPMSREDKKLMRQQKAQRRAQIGGRAFGALGTASMIAGMGSMMGGPVGDISQKLMGPLMAASALSGILPMLMNPVGLVVAGLGAAVGGFMLLQKTLKDATESGREAAKAMTMTSDELEEMAKGAGNVTASSVAERRRAGALSGGERVNSQYGQSFMDSEFGKSFLSQAENRIKEGESSKAIAQGFSEELSYAILQGAVTQEQAMSIAAELGYKLQDYSISSKIQADLVALYGPNGENLLTDPLSIATQIQSGQTKQQVAAYENFENTRTTQRQETTSGTLMNQIAGGAMTAIGAGVTFASGGTLSALGVPLMIAGMTTMLGAEIVETIGDTQEINKAAGVAVQLGAEQLAQNQGLLDSIQMQYDNQIKQLEAKKEAAKTDEERAEIEAQISSKIEQRDASLEKQKQANAEIFRNISEQAEAMGPQFTDAINLAIDERFKDASGAMKAAAELAKESLAGLQDGDFKTTLSIGLASGELDPITVSNLINANEAGGGVISSKFNLLIEAQGTAEANQIVQMLAASGVETKNYGIMLDLFANNADDFSYYSDALLQISQLGTEYGVQVDLNVNGDQKIAEVAQNLKDVDGLPPIISQEILTTYLEEHPGMSADSKDKLRTIIDNWEAFSKGSNTAKFDILVNFMAGGSQEAAAWAYFLANNPDMKKNLEEAGAAGFGAGFYEKYIGQAMAEFFGQGNTGETPKQTTDPGNTGGTATDPIDGILERLKRLRDLAIDAKGGITVLKDVINSGLTKFFGTDQKLLFSGYSSDFINAVMAMDESTRERFVKIKDGVLTVTSSGKALAKAYSEIKLGEFSMSLTQGLADTNKQIQAMNILQSRGLSNADSFDIVRDASLAYAIATAATTEEVDALIASYRKLEDAQYDLKTSTTAGMESEIGSAFNDIKEFFSAQEEAVNLAFEVNSAASNAIIAEAQNQIMDYQYVVDDLNYALDQIKEQEDEINEKYDKRVEALEKVSEVNQDIINQEKGQLGIAQALASGDIAAAARAVQDYRADQAKRQQDRAKEVLDVAREREIASITAENGKTRLEIETELKDLQKEIAAIEEERLEPAQKYLRELQRQRDLALEAIGEDGYLGKTKKEWANVENAVRLAKVESEGFTDSIKEALLLIPQLKDAYKNNGTQEGPADDGLTQEQRDAIAKIKSNRQAVRDSDGTTAADKVMMQENIRLIKMLDAAGISRSLFMSGGGMVPKYYAAGGYARGTDSIPAMLTPGEFVVRKYAVDKFGADRLKAINSGAYNGGNMYNSYELNVNVKSDANPDQIARAVMTQIKQIDSQRMRSNRF
jgi:TP901 family phage tail tape measure protein